MLLFVRLNANLKTCSLCPSVQSNLSFKCRFTLACPLDVRLVTKHLVSLSHAISLLSSYYIIFADSYCWQRVCSVPSQAHRIPVLQSPQLSETNLQSIPLGSLFFFLMEVQICKYYTALKTWFEISQEGLILQLQGKDGSIASEPQPAWREPRFS